MNWPEAGSVLREQRNELASKLASKNLIWRFHFAGVSVLLPSGLLRHVDPVPRRAPPVLSRDRFSSQEPSDPLVALPPPSLRKAPTAACLIRLQQGFAIRGMGVNCHFGQHQFARALVPSGSQREQEIRISVMIAGPSSLPVSSASKTLRVSVATFCPLLSKRSSLEMMPSASGC